MVSWCGPWCGPCTGYVLVVSWCGFMVWSMVWSLYWICSGGFLVWSLYWICSGGFLVWFLGVFPVLDMFWWFLGVVHGGVHVLDMFWWFLGVVHGGFLYWICPRYPNPRYLTHMGYIVMTCAGLSLGERIYGNIPSVEIGDIWGIR